MQIKKKEKTIFSIIISILMLLATFFVISYFTKETLAVEITPEMRQQILNGELDLTYEMFGAVGDGVTDDVAAIRDAHNYANSLFSTNPNITVYGTSTATYYIGNVTTAISIKTNVDWRNCNFIIDDFIDENGDGVNDVSIATYIFYIEPSEYGILDIGKPNDIAGVEPIVVERGMTNMSNLIQYLRELTAAQVIANDGRPGITDTYLNTLRNVLLSNDEILVEVINSNKKQFIRTGEDLANAGEDQQDRFLIDIATGDLQNDIMWDFEEITKIYLLPVEKEPITIKNGNFTTYTNNYAYNSAGVAQPWTYRNIRIYRSKVTLDNVNHTLDESVHEITPNAPQTNGQGNVYVGFINTNRASYFTFKNSTIQPHQTINGSGGTYDMALNGTVGISLDNISYSCPTGKTDAECYTLYVANINGRWARWGVMTSNYSKDMVITNSKLNRVDAHNGIMNLTILDSTLGQYSVMLMGVGTFRAERVTIDGNNAIINLRGDYGSSWEGDMILKDIHWILPPMNITIIDYQNNGDHDYGFDCYYPNLSIENLHIDDTGTTARISLIPTVQPATTRSDPYFFFDYVRMKNITSERGNTFSVFPYVSNQPSTNYLDMSYYGSGQQTKVDIYGTALREPDVNIYNFPTSQFTVSVDELPSAEFGPNGSNTASENHSTSVTVATDGVPIIESSLKYVWTESDTIEPADNEFINTFTNGQTVQKTATSGVWYLWVYAEDEMNNIVKQVSNGFAFGEDDITDPSISFSVTSGINFSLKPTLDGELMTDDITANVSTTNQTGYTLSMRTIGPNSNLNFTAGTNTFSILNTNNTNPGELENNTWGFNINTGITPEIFKSIPSTKTAIKTNYDSNIGSEDTIITIGMKINGSIPSGNYSNSLLFTAVSNP